MALQGGGRHLDRELVVAHPGDPHARDLREPFELVARARRDLAKLGLGQRPGHDHADDLVDRARHRHPRALGLGGQPRDARDPLLDLVGDLARLGRGVDRRVHAREALGRARGEALDALDVRDRLLDPDRHAALDLLRRRARERDRDRDGVELEAREHLERHARDERREPGRDDRDHQEVRGDAVPDEPGDQGVHGAALSFAARRRPRRRPVRAPAARAPAAPAPRRSPRARGSRPRPSRAAS